MKVITAPEYYELKDGEISVFLAGGITNCPEWQDEVIKELEKIFHNTSINDKIVVFNPRRKNFPINKPEESTKQIEWEFNALLECDIFSMYFSSGESDQPICLYELGRNLTRLQWLNPAGWEDQIVLSVFNGYRRRNEVIIQTSLATSNRLGEVKINTDDDENMLIHKHALNISEKIYVIHSIRNGRC